MPVHVDGDRSIPRWLQLLLSRIVIHWKARDEDKVNFGNVPVRVGDAIGSGFVRKTVPADRRVLK